MAEKRLRDFYGDLSADQEKLCAALQEFLQGDGQVFLLKGYAGTGKTFLLGGLCHYYIDYLQNPVSLTAPTGKAADVLAKKTGCFSGTIFSAIYTPPALESETDRDFEGNDDFRMVAQLKQPAESYSQLLLIVDESSLISDVDNKQEFLVFGTGKLLTDIFTYMDLKNNPQRKIIFVGDPAQLPPIGMVLSPALSGDYLRKNFDQGSQEYELTEVVRQKSGSTILHNAFMLRQAIVRKVFTSLNFDCSRPDFQSTGIDAMMDAAENHLRQNHECAIIAYSNNQVNRYNKMMRERLFPDKNEVQAGDLLLIVQNNFKYRLFNGQIAKVTQVLQRRIHHKVNLKFIDRQTHEKKTTPVDLYFTSLALSISTPSGTVELSPIMISEDLLYSNDPQLPKDKLKALYVDFAIRFGHLRSKNREQYSLKSAKC